MKRDDRGQWRPRHFDVAGAHPDEAWRAVANIFEAVGDIRRRLGAQLETPLPLAKEACAAVERWQASKPLRFGNAADAQVQRFLEQGVQLMDGLKQVVPLGFTDNERQTRNRCSELAKSMEKVLQRRPDDYRRGVTRGRGRSL